jgi:glycine cleavage system H protein
VGGTVSEVNDQLADSPELVNNDPYGDGWMLKLKDVQPGSAQLVDQAGYEKLTAG